MSELYTSITQTKMALNGGRLPPMTPLTERARRFVDPAFTIGMGALMEDPKRGLRCPVRGCGGYYHALTQHLNRKHRAIGGARAVVGALSIAQTTALVSASLRCRLRNKPRPNNLPLRRGGAIGERISRSLSETANTVAALNLRNSCEAQVAERILVLQRRFGKTPTQDQAGPQLYAAARRLYGTWGRAVEVVGLTANPRHTRATTQREIESAIEAWVHVHGRMPTTVDARDPEQLPILPHYDTVLKAFGVQSWRTAMSHLAWLLGHEDAARQTA